MEGKQARVLIACPTWSGMEYSLKPWADAVKAQEWPESALGTLQVDNSDGPQTGGNLHYLHTIRGHDIDAVWQTVRFPALWDTLELSWEIMVSHAHAEGYDFIFSVEADVVIPPDATRKMVEAAYAGARDGKVACVTQRYHPRGQPGPDFWWDTLGCSLFPVEPLWADRYRTKAIFEIECFLSMERHGHPRVRPGRQGHIGDLFIPEHLSDPDDPVKYVYGATPAPVTYRNRVLAASKEKPVGSDAALRKEEAPGPTIPMGIVKEPETPPDGACLDEPYAGRRAHKQAAPAIDDMMGDEALAEKVTSESLVRLNLGCDRVQMSGFLGVDSRPEVDPDIVADVRDLSMFEDDSVEEVYASHVLEHLTWDDGLAALTEWRRVLKPGGMLTIAVPDLVQIYFLAKHGATWGEYQMAMDPMYVQATAFGAHLLAGKIPEMRDQYANSGHEHRSIYIFDMLLNRVIEAGYVFCHEVQGCFLRRAALGETMVQARKPKEGD